MRSSHPLSDHIRVSRVLGSFSCMTLPLCDWNVLAVPGWGKHWCYWLACPSPRPESTEMSHIVASSATMLHHRQSRPKQKHWNSHYNMSLMHSFILPSSGILHMGNGENVFISQQPPVIGSVMGNGRRRSISCPSCNGLADGNKLLAPVALACGSDGSLYVGDFNYVRRIFTTGNVTSVLELR